MMFASTFMSPEVPVMWTRLLAVRQTTEQFVPAMNSIRNYVLEVRLKMTNLIKLGLQAATGEFFTHYPPDLWIHPGE